MNEADKKKALAVGAGGIALLLLSGFAKPKPRPTAECPPFPKIPRKQLENFVSTAVAGGEKGLDRVSALAGKALFPTDPQTKDPILWPVNPPHLFPTGTPEHISCLYTALRSIIGELDVPDEPEEPPNPGKIYNQFTSKDPTPGKFWKVKKGWTAAGKGSKRLLYTALKKVSAELADSASRRLHYLRCMTLSDWNRGLYGAPKRSKSWNDTYGFDTPDGKYWLWPAFMPWHENAISSIVNGKMPRRKIANDGGWVSNGSYGLLWLPPIDEQVAMDVGEVACNLTYDDGSSTLEPPPALLDLLE